MGDINLFVCCHNESEVPAHPLLIPIQVGTALAERRFAGYAHDDEGENISRKNRAYCELTAQYWAWKNCQAEYVGFFHYRRYLYPDEAASAPYRIERLPSEKLLAELGYDRFASTIRNFDIIVPREEEMFISVREHYAGAPYHHYEDLERAEDILRHRHPEFARAAEKYLSGSKQLFGNIFIMKKDVFNDYCQWLFPVLEEFDARKNPEYTGQETRVDGYLAERLFGIYYMERKEQLKTKELPRVHFEPNRARFAGQWLEKALLPPGTKRRAIAKKFIK